MISRFSIFMAMLAGFTSQSTFASQNWQASEAEGLSGSKSANEGEWIDFYAARVPGAKSPDDRDIYSLKRSDVGTGVQVACGWVPNSPRNRLRPHCGASTVWVKGDHSKNRNVRHRTSLTRYGIKCNNWEYSKDQYISYSSSEEIISQWEKVGELRSIVPGSFEERIARVHCKYSQ
jgi:hypothetical protein